MVLFLTSDIGVAVKENGATVPHAINNKNKLLDQLKESIKGYKNLVFVCSKPDGFTKTDMYANCLYEGFKLSGLNFENITVLDDRTKANAKEIIKSADMVFLAGGHVPTQNAFFKEIGLKELLNNFDGVIMGQSAGSMNMAKDVYNYPESEEEINDPIKLEGLGLTNFCIMPHFVPKNEENLNRATLTDMFHKIYQNYFKEHDDKFFIYVLVDGSHIKVENNVAMLYGKGYVFDHIVGGGKLFGDFKPVNLDVNPL